jgi:hypothetical protein
MLTPIKFSKQVVSGRREIFVRRRAMRVGHCAPKQFGEYELSFRFR